MKSRHAAYATVSVLIFEVQTAAYIEKKTRNHLHATVVFFVNDCNDLH